MEKAQQWSGPRGSFLRNIGIVLGISLAITLGTSTVNEAYNWEAISYTFLFTFTITFFLWFGNHFVSSVVPYSWVEQPRRHLVVTVVMTIILVLITTGLARSLSLALCCGVGPVRAVRTTPLVDLLSVFLITGLISAVVHSQAFLREWKASIIASEQLKQANLASEYEILKQQVNPHFLFNSLNVLHTLVYKDADLAARFIRQLSKVYRYVLDGRRQKIVPLRDELEVLQAYYELVKTRFGASLQLEMAIDESSESLGIVPLSTQILLENVVKHNAFSAQSPLQARLYTSGEWLWLENPVRRQDKKVDTTGLGLENIRRRYQYVVDREIRVDDHTDVFRVGLPLIKR